MLAFQASNALQAFPAFISAAFQFHSKISIEFYSIVFELISNYILIAFPNCFQIAFKLLSNCIPISFQLHSQCFPIVFNCITINFQLPIPFPRPPIMFQMHSYCFPISFQISIELLFNCISIDFQFHAS